MLPGNGWIFNMQEEGFLAHVIATELWRMDKQALKRTNADRQSVEKNKPGDWDENDVAYLLRAAFCWGVGELERGV